MNRPRLIAAIQEVVELLVAKEYAALAGITQQRNLPAEQIEAAIADYGRTLVHPPSTAFDSLDVIQVRGSTPAEFSVWLPLFTAEEGRSDLQLRTTIVDDPSRIKMRVEIDGILVP